MGQGRHLEGGALFVLLVAITSWAGGKLGAMSKSGNCRDRHLVPFVG
jgi:hypothetical protein